MSASGWPSFGGRPPLDTAGGRITCCRDGVCALDAALARSADDDAAAPRPLIHRLVGAGDDLCPHLLAVWIGPGAGAGEVAFLASLAEAVGEVLEEQWGEALCRRVLRAAPRRP